MVLFRDALLSLPGVAALVDDVEHKAWARRPSIPAEALFADPSAVDVIEWATEQALNSTTR